MFQKLIDVIVERDSFSVFASDDIGLLNNLEKALKSQNILTLNGVKDDIEIYNFFHYLLLNKLTGVCLYTSGYTSLHEFIKENASSARAAIWSAAKVTMLKNNVLYVAKDRYGLPYTEELNVNN